MRTLIGKLGLAAFAGAAAYIAAGAPHEARAEIYCGYDNQPAFNAIPSQGPVNCPTPTDINTSLIQTSNSQIGNLVTHNRLASPLLGGTEQINCGDCFRGFGMAGSFSLGFNGRKNVTDRLSVLGGLSYNEFDSKSTKTTRAPIFALGLRYDLADWGGSRPFFEVSGSLSPNERVQSTRVVFAGGIPGVLRGATDATTWSANARAGWVYRLSPTGELAGYLSYSRTEQRYDGYTETGNLLLMPLTYGARTSSINVVKGVVQHTQLFTSFLEGHVSAAIAHGFGARSAIAATAVFFPGVFTAAAKDTTWAEFDARLGFRVMKGTVIDVFAITTVGPKPVGNTIHGGLGLRYLF